MRRPVDEGFSLVEVLVAAVVLAVGAAAVAAVLVNALQLSRGNGQRVQAAALMTAELESARGEAVDVLPEGKTSYDVDQQGTRYTVAREVAWRASGGGADPCTTATSVTVTKTVAVTVTWPGMGATAPVRGDTQLSATPTSSVLATLPGSVAVVVGGADGTGVAGVNVRLVGPSPASTSRTATTNSAGCASFPDTPAGAFEALATRSGYVARTQSATATTGSFTVVAGRATKPRAVLDRAATLIITTTTTPTTAQQRAGIPLTLDAPFSTPTTRRAYPGCPVVPSGTSCLSEDASASKHTAALLFPGTYRVAGCGSGAGESRSLGPGTTVPSSVALGTAALRGPLGGTSAPPSTVYVRPGAGSACAGTPTLVLSTTGATTNRDVPLPDGPWQFSSTAAFSSSVTATLVAGSSTTVAVP